MRCGATCSRLASSRTTSSRACSLRPQRSCRWPRGRCACNCPRMEIRRCPTSGVLTHRSAQVESCFGVLSALQASRRRPGVGVLTSLLQLCAHNDVAARVVDIWALVAAERLRVTPHMLSAALRCCALAARDCPEARTLAARLEAQLRDRWLAAAGVTWRSDHSYCAAFNALLGFHAAAAHFDAGLATWQVRPAILSLWPALCSARARRQRCALFAPHACA
jgi:hypothetical protein